jgi:nucleoid DNA-binding protein
VRLQALWDNLDALSTRLEAGRTAIEANLGQEAAHKPEDVALNKKERLSRYAQKRGVLREQANNELVCLLETIAEGLMIDEEVVISNFGVFEVVEPMTRTFKLPRGGEAAARQESKVKFRPSRNLTQFVNGNKKPIAVKQ